MQDNLEVTLGWFKEAVPTPTAINKRSQVGVHVEEVAEMLEALGFDVVAKTVHEFGNGLKTGTETIGTVDRKELLDSLCDQIVTATGIAHMFGLDIVAGMRRVNASNYSKFVDGKAIFNENGKITKGPDYKKPNLEGLY